MSARTLTLVRMQPGPSEITRVLGTVAEAVVFSDGLAVLHWLTSPQGTEIYSSEQVMREVRECSGRSAFCPDGPADLPDGVTYHVFLSVDEEPGHDPAGHRHSEPATLAGAVADLQAAAAAGADYACLEILRDKPVLPAPPVTADVPVTGELL